MALKTWLESRTPARLLDRYRTLKFEYGFKTGRRTWSQDGEDMVLRKIINKERGFYVDIGAHHPYRFSNTFFLFQRGWCGINVDALPEAIHLFNKFRPSDININVGIAQGTSVLKYFQFNDAAFNTFDEKLAHHVNETVAHAKLLQTVHVETMRLSDLLDTWMPSETKIDLMNIDVEGMDQKVVQSNNWEKYHPDILLVEFQWMSVEEIMNTTLYKYLFEHGYHLYAKCVNTAIFRSSN